MNTVAQPATKPTKHPLTAAAAKPGARASCPPPTNRARPAPAKSKQPKPPKQHPGGVIKIPLALISHHPATGHVPLSPEDSEEITILVRDIQERGVDQPIMVVPDKLKGLWLLVDGRHRFAGAKQAGLSEIPAIVRKESEVPGIILSSLVLRKHFTKGALAYIAYPLVAEKLCKEGGNGANQYRTIEQPSIESTVAHLPRETGKPDPFSDSDTPFSAELLGEQFGFGRDLFFQAKRLHEIFAQDAAYKARIEPHILSGETGLGAAIAGFAGKATTKGVTPTAAKYLLLNARGQCAGLMPKALITLENGFKQWPKLDLTARARLKERWDKLCAALPEDLQ